MVSNADRKLVLLAEDNEDNRLIFSTVLRHYGYRVQEVATGPEALEAVRSCPPDALVLDISLPELDGWTVAARLKDGPATRDVPILAVTAHAFPEDEERARALGCDAFLRKPARPQRVFEEVQRLIGGPSSPALRDESP
jgi:two-component system, cell cycle response regulator DivK